MKITLVGENNRIIRAGENHTFTGTETYEDVMNLCQEIYEDANIKGLRIGQLKSKNIPTFGQDTLRTFMTKKHIAPSRAKVYVIQDETAVNPRPVSKKRKLEDEQEMEAGNMQDEQGYDQEMAAGNMPDEQHYEQEMAAGDAVNNDEEDLGPVNQSKQLDTISIIDFKDIRKGKRIDKGGCAKVYEGDWKGTRVALKERHFATVGDAERVKSLITEEIALLATIRHPNVLPFYGITKDEGMFAVKMITELMETDLGKHIYGKRKAMSFSTKVFVAKEIVKGIEHLHNRKVVHGDIKPPNILVSNDGKSVKVCDFGLSRVKERESNPS